MTRIVIPAFEGNLSELFCQCSHFVFVEIEKSVVKTYSVEVPSINDLPELLDWLKDKNVTDVIAHKIDKQIINQFIILKMNLFLGIEIRSLKHIIAEYLNGNLLSDEKLIAEIIHHK